MFAKLAATHIHENTGAVCEAQLITGHTGWPDGHYVVGTENITGDATDQIQKANTALSGAYCVDLCQISWAHDERMAVSTLADAFSTALGSILSEEEMQSVRERNRSADEMICHSHDFVDANEVMAQAFEFAFGLENAGLTDATRELWNSAWSLAKAREFHPSSPAAHANASMHP